MTMQNNFYHLDHDKNSINAITPTIMLQEKMSRVWVTLDGVLDRILDLLTTLTHN
jgi:hypothetical protein